MRRPEFWWHNTIRARLTAAALAPLGTIYGASVAWKHWSRSPYSSRVPVICVGNLTVGGTGKTPVAIAIARMAQKRGVLPVFLSRGYGRAGGNALVVDTQSHDAATVGDEALLLARVAPTIVSRDRALGARLVEAQRAQMIIMDDGHQNFSLQKDLSIVVVDGDTGFGNGRTVPAGPLRESMRQGLRRTDAVIVMGNGSPALPSFSGPVLRARLAPARRLDGQRVVAFAGIGRPEKFFATLREAGADVAETHAFADHHTYTAAEIGELKRRAAQLNSGLITTEKDFVRLGTDQRTGIDVLSVQAAFEDETELAFLLSPLIANMTWSDER